MSLSYKDSKGSMAIAVRTNYHLKKNKLVFYSNNVDSDDVKPDEITDEVLVELFGRTATRYRHQREKLKENLLKQVEKGVFKDSRKTQELTITDSSVFNPKPTMEEDRDILFLMGSAKSGKSFLAKIMLQYYIKMGINPKRIFIINPKGVKDENKLGDCGKFKSIDLFVTENEDKGYDKQLQRYKEAKIKHKYRKRELKNDPEGLVEIEIALEKLKPNPADRKKKGFELSDYFFRATEKPSVFVLDDYEAFNPADRAKCEWLIQKIGEIGRHRKVNLIMITHMLDGNKQKVILNEAHYYVVFSKSIPRNNRRLLSDYVGLEKGVVNRVMDTLKSNRFVCINKNNRYAVAPKKVFLY